MPKVNEYYPHHWYEYGEKYKDWIKLKFEDGILEVRFHTDDGPMQWCSGPQAAIDNICFDINHDPDVECVIITGTGDYFMKGNISTKDPRAASAGWSDDWRNPWSTYDYWYHYQTLEPLNIAFLQCPVIAAVNGPQHVHPELTLCGDICIASDNAYFTEFHFKNMGVPPGDGTWPIWRELIGHNRARALMYMGGKVTAQDLLEWGVLYEVMPLEKLNDRAWEIARQVMKTPRYGRRMTRTLLNQHWKRLFVDELESGLAHEGFAGICDADFWSDEECKRAQGAGSDVGALEFENENK